jgi:pyruvate kinase
MRILPTIGPVSESTNSLKKINKFTNIFRLNGSHNNINWHKNIIKKIKSLNKNNKILFDVPGIKPRTANDKEIVIKKNQIVCFYFKKKNKIKDLLNIQLTKPIPQASKFLKYFSLSDGSYIFRLKKISKNIVVGYSVQDFILKPNKGLNLPGAVYDNDLQIKTSLKFLQSIKKLEFESMGLSFVQDEKIVKLIKKVFPQKLITAKIENSQGLKNINQIVKYSDVIMIDRGDLSAEIGEQNLFNAIIKISEECREFGKPLIMATENLDSMMKNLSPTKSEVVSISFSEHIKADQIMLSDETATSKNYLKTLKWLNNFINSNKNKNYKKQNLNNETFFSSLKNINNETVIIFTKKGYVVDKILNINRNLKLFVFSDNQFIINHCYFRSNCTPVKTKRFPKKMEAFIFKYIKDNKNNIFRLNNRAFLTYSSYPKKNVRANTLSFVTKNLF